MAPSPPPYSTPKYWDDRFTKTPAPYDWLLPANALDGPLAAALFSHGQNEGHEPKVLHIGCGTSLLSYHLRAHVRKPRQIWNVDFSERAIALGSQREKEIFGADQENVTPVDSQEKRPKATAAEEGSSEAVSTASAGEQLPEHESAAVPRKEAPAASQAQSLDVMNWRAVDLLSLPSVASTLPIDSFSVIVDKSTSDSIACGEDVLVPFPFTVYASGPHSSTALHGRPPTTIPPHTTSDGESSVAIPASGQRESSADLRELEEPVGPATTTSNPENNSKEVQADQEERQKDNRDDDSSRVSTDEYFVHPLTLLALHLALVAKPFCQWICLSYSEDRFSFLPSSAEPYEPPAKTPCPTRFWRLKAQYAVMAEEKPLAQDQPGKVEGKDNRGETSTPVHRPEIRHWMYVLERTEEEAHYRLPEEV